MTVSICAYDMPAGELFQLAIAADEFGFDALWLGEHLVLPVDFETAHPTTGTASHTHKPGAVVKPDTVLLDPFVQLAAIAGATNRLRVATAIYILPLRHPLITARAACTMQEVSNGRLVLGVGVGWLAEEFAALDVPFEARRARFDETVEILRLAYAGGPFSYEGSQFQLPPVQVSAEPVDVPLIFAGNTEKALQKAAARADGWFGSGTPTFDEARRLVARLRELRGLADIDTGTDDPFHCYVRIDGCDPATVERYRAGGLEDVVVWADQLWKVGAGVDRNRAAMTRFATDAGLTPSTSAAS